MRIYLIKISGVVKSFTTAAAAVAAVIITFLIPREAVVSQIHYRYITLQELVQRAPYIFIVKRATPETTLRKVPIHQDREKHPDFMHVTFHFEIIETLRGPKELTQGQKIDVLPANSDEEFSLHKEYYIDGLSVSPIYDGYRSAVDPNSATVLIIFVGLHDEKRFQLIVTNACEGVGRKEEILKMMKGVDQENTAR